MKKVMIIILMLLAVIMLEGCGKVEKIKDSLLVKQTVSNKENKTVVYRYTPDNFVFEGGSTPLLLVLASEGTQEYIEKLMMDGFREIAQQQHCSVVFVTPANGNAFTEEDYPIVQMVAGNTSEVYFPNKDYSAGVDSKGRFLSSHFRIYVFADAQAKSFSQDYLQSPDADYYVEEWSSNAGGFGAGFVVFSKPEDILPGFESVVDTTRIFLEDGNSYLEAYHNYEREGISVSEKSYKCSSNRTISYVEYWPEEVKKDGSAPLVVLFHGRSTNAAAYAQQSNWPMIGEENGFVVISVYGAYDLFNSKNVSKKLTHDTYEMIKAYTQENGIDKEHIYATGFSQGAYRALALGTMYPDFFKAIAPCDMVTSKGLNFESEIPTMIIAGDDDFYYVLPTQNKWCGPMIDNIAQANGVALKEDENNVWGYQPLESSVIKEGAYSINVNVYGDNLVLCDVEGMSHNIAPSASTLIWEFFADRD